MPTAIPQSSRRLARASAGRGCQQQPWTRRASTGRIRRGNSAWYPTTEGKPLRVQHLRLYPRRREVLGSKKFSSVPPARWYSLGVHRYRTRRYSSSPLRAGAGGIDGRPRACARAPHPGLQNDVIIPYSPERTRGGCFSHSLVYMYACSLYELWSSRAHESYSSFLNPSSSLSFSGTCCHIPERKSQSRRPFREALTPRSCCDSCAPRTRAGSGRRRRQRRQRRTTTLGHDHLFLPPLNHLPRRHTERPPQQGRTLLTSTLTTAEAKPPWRTATSRAYTRLARRSRIRRWFLPMANTKQRGHRT